MIKIISPITKIKAYIRQLAIAYIRKEIEDGLMKKRRQHNRNLLREYHKEVRNVVCSGYWRGDISDYMKSTIFGTYSTLSYKLDELLHKVR